jgi:drug/metabolite transporter (DMT)-like permease
MPLRQMPLPQTLTPSRSPGRAIGLMIAAIVFFTAMDAVAKGLLDRYPTPQVIWARFAGQLVLVLLIVRGRAMPLLRTRYARLHLLRCACQFGATALFFTSLGYIGLAEATALTDLNPVLITLGAAVFLGENLGPRRLIGVAAAMIGAMIVIRPGFGVFTPAALLPIGAAICYTGNALITRFIGPNESAWTSMIFAAAFGTAVLVVVQPFVWVPIAAGDLTLFGLMGALGTGAQLCIIRSFSMSEASVVAPFAYLGIVFAAIWGAVLYAEYPDRWSIVGALVIIAAGLYVWHRETQAASAAQ